jgi:hypothetical protein
MAVTVKIVDLLGCDAMYLVVHSRGTSCTHHDCKWPINAASTFLWNVSTHSFKLFLF